MKRKPKRKYVIKKGARLPKGAITDLVPVMASLADKHELTPSRLLETARSPKSPAHRFFEWNDAKAAEEYRLVQARFFIRSIEIVVKGVPGVRAFHEVTIRKDTTRFEATDSIMQNQSLTNQLLSRAKEELKSWRLRYEMLRRFSELDDIFSAVDSLNDP